MDVFTIKMFTISGEESLKLGVIPILYDEGFNYNEAGERIVP
jgi:hypothetical protein